MPRPGFPCRLGLTVVLLLAACTTRRVPPITAPEVTGTDDDERRLVMQADAIEYELRTRGLVYEDAALQRYLDRVTARLVPAEAAAHVRFRPLVVRSAGANAYALPNGVVCLDAGLLSRIADEAQLAHVLGHEISHVVARHQLTALRDRSSKRVAAKLVGIVLAPTVFADPAIGSLYAASVAGYGREREEEADRDGLRLVAAAGYPLATVPHLFTNLESLDRPAAHGDSPYSDHPSAEARARYTQALIAAGVPGTSPHDADTERYRDATRLVLLESIRLRLASGHLRDALADVDTGLARWPTAAPFHLYAGEAHRRLATDRDSVAYELVVQQVPDAKQAVWQQAREESELTSALAAYRRALALDPGLGEAHRGLGLAAIDQGDAETARRELEQYLGSGGKILDRRFIEALLRELAP